MSSNIKSLNEGQIKAYISAFKLIDPNGNFQIELSDYFTIMENLGIEQSITPEEFADLQYGTDVDNQTTIGITEFCDVLAGHKVDTPDDVAAAYSVFDPQGNQSLTREEIATALGGFNVSLTDGEMDALFEEADKDKDGQITMEEFLQVITYATQLIKKQGLPPGID